MIHTSTHSIVSSQGREPRLLTLILGKIDDYVFMRLLIDSVPSRFFWQEQEKESGRIMVAAGQIASSGLASL